MPDATLMTEGYEPNDPAPKTGYYEELDARGRPTGYVVHARQGEALPGAAPGFTWRLTEPRVG